MRILFVVQRYGHEVFGGAEAACRDVASRLAARGHDVHAVTSCALSYVDWADHYPPGTDTLDGVTVHRLRVSGPRQHRFFQPLNARVVWGRKPVPLLLQREWMRTQGPDLPELVPWLEREAASFDVVVFFTYLYATSWAGLPVASGLAPTVLFPTAHDEPPMWLSLFDTTFRLPTAYGFLTEEEEALIERRARVRRPSAVVGLGVDLEVVGDGERFRRTHGDRLGFGDRPYLLYVGRLDPGKGSDELYDFFAAYKQRHPDDDLALVYVGEPVKPLEPHPDIFCTGFVPQEDRADAFAGCLAFVMPSYFESFSLVLCEAWAQRKPALVQGHCDVLVGQARRSSGAIPYWGYADFEAAVERLAADEETRRWMGEAGRAYVEDRYRWETVLDRCESLFAIAARRRHRSVPAVATVPLIRPD